MLLQISWLFTIFVLAQNPLAKNPTGRCRHFLGIQASLKICDTQTKADTNMNLAVHICADWEQGALYQLSDEWYLDIDATVIPAWSLRIQISLSTIQPLLAHKNPSDLYTQQSLVFILCLLVFCVCKRPPVEGNEMQQEAWEKAFCWFKISHRY